MTERVDFYVLKSATVRQRLTFACRLTEKAYLKNLTVVVMSETAADADAIDELLWTFSERSFVPHELHRGTPAAGAPAPVQLTADPEAIEAADLLVNLSARLPARWQRFSRIAEIIDADDERRRSGRERFKTYRDSQLTVETHQLDDAASA
jgi:DNA polymerase-3 subunit chi